MQQIHKIALILSLLFSISFHAKATHAMGGSITWNCLGNGDYIFELKFYRDCNGFDVNVNHEELEVWGHPNLTKIDVKYVSREDISPQCTASGGFTPFICGSGTSGGNGVGAVEEVTYRSDPITIIGTPPTSGWHFTFQHFSRSSNLTNLQSPTTHGITVAASMYPIPGNNGGCIDNSPVFLEQPYIVSCAGSNYKYNPNAVDPDRDSIAIKWGEPLDYFPAGSYSPPANPSPIPFINSYSYQSSTPDASFNPNNQAISLDSQTGEINFKSFTTGNFASKIIVESYRNNTKIAVVEREIQFIIDNCSNTNNSPTVTPPFNGGTSFETEVFAGDLVQFNLSASDYDLLQDGNPQSVTISSSGLMYGANFTNPSAGCGTPPCATLQNPSVTGVQTASLGFNWQTDCSHLNDANGMAKNEMDYLFIFKIQDDYCPIPRVEYATVKVKVKNQNVLPAPHLKCVSYLSNGDIQLNWDPISDPYNTFSGYEIKDDNGTSYGVEHNINSNSFTITGATSSSLNLFVATLSGCGGFTARNSDTISTIFLELDNPGDGRAHLKWNKPSPQAKNGFNTHYDIYKEYPTGVWNLIGNTPYNTTTFFDTITVCQALINYKVVLSSTECNFTSNIAGDIFEDKIVPNIPTIANVGYDTITGELKIFWDVNQQKDTYGYVVYQTDNFGNVVPIDTVWGRTNTSYSHFVDAANGSYQYSIAAFDSCYTTNIPPTYQTSAKANPHTTNFLEHSVDVCARTVVLNWSRYLGFNDVKKYIVHTSTNHSPWEIKGDTQANTFSFEIVAGDEIIVTVEAISSDGINSFSNIDTVRFEGESGPKMSYLSVASVENEEVIVKYRVTSGEIAQSVILERYNPKTAKFEMIKEKKIPSSNEVKFTDTEAEVNRRSYTYRAKVLDTCGQLISYSNIGQTIFLNVIPEQELETNILQWTPYTDFLGNVQKYNIYRSIGYSYPDELIGTIYNNVRTYEDYIGDLNIEYNGKICYRIEAVEGSNAFSETGETSRSNNACSIFEPTIFIPNAFTVGGENPIFKPITRNRMIKDYLFEIYDRYGRVVFFTDDPDEGWNGQLVGQKRTAQEGVYVYRLSLKNGEGIDIIKYGHVTLLNDRP